MGSRCLCGWKLLCRKNSEIEAYVKVVETEDIVVEVENLPLKIDNVLFATNSFFTVFSYPLLQGKTESLLTEPYTAAISQSTALKIFGSTNVVGKTLPVSGESAYRITGYLPICLLIPSYNLIF